MFSAQTPARDLLVSSTVRMGHLQEVSEFSLHFEIRVRLIPLLLYQWGRHRTIPLPDNYLGTNYLERQGVRDPFNFQQGEHSDFNTFHFVHAGRRVRVGVRDSKCPDSQNQNCPIPGRTSFNFLRIPVVHYCSSIWLEKQKFQIAELKRKWLILRKKFGGSNHKINTKTTLANRVYPPPPNSQLNVPS